MDGIVIGVAWQRGGQKTFERDSDLDDCDFYLEQDSCAALSPIRILVTVRLLPGELEGSEHGQKNIPVAGKP